MDFTELAVECAPMVSPQTMAAIVRTESGFKPYAIGVNGGARLQRQPSTREEAIVTANWLIAQGYNVDLGLGQVNSSNLARMGLSVEGAFDPCKNLAASASILSSSYQLASRVTNGEQSALRAALSAYNTGTFSRGFANGYVQKVVANVAGAEVAPIKVVAVKPRESRRKSASKGNADDVASASEVGVTKDALELDRGDEWQSTEQGVMVYR